jgi:tetratricopeptide (TPR) repeat protein
MDPAKLKQLDAEVAAADAIVKKNPSNVIGYLQRGNAYGNERRWDLARSDYQKALEIDPKCTTASFNTAELDFLQGRYDAARPGFLAIVNNTDFGDLAKYKVFLCDLFGGHEQVAARELAVFNQIGSEASYYFANVAWSLYHNKASAAQSWWQSATQIFAPDKVNLYAKPLIDLGYIKVAS